MDTSQQIPTRAPVATLSLGSFCLALGIVLAIFVGLNPIWDATDVQSWDENVWYSYAPIPLLVALLLWRERKLAWGPFLVDTMKLGLVKLVITYCTAHAIWAVQGPPPLREEAPPAATTTTSGDGFAPGRQGPEPSVLDPQRTGTVSVVVRDGAGRPRSDVIVRVVDGLRELVFAPPAETLELVNAGHGFTPAVAVAHTWQDVRLVSRDDTLHTAVLEDARRLHVLNYPLVAGATRELMFRRAHGVMTVRCSVHGDAEGIGQVLVVDNPFVASTDGRGYVSWSGVPVGRLRVSVWSPSSASRVDRMVELKQGVTELLDITLP